MLIVRTISVALVALFLFPAESNSFAQQTFEIKRGSAVYDIEVKIRCDEERKRLAPSDCTGPGR